MWGYGFDGGVSWLGMGLMMFFGLLVTVGIVLLLVWLVRAPSGRATGAGMRMDADEALTVVRRRFAAGEITKEQYEEIVRTLRV